MCKFLAPFLVVFLSLHDLSAQSVQTRFLKDNEGRFIISDKTLIGFNATNVTLTHGDKERAIPLLQTGERVLSVSTNSGHTHLCIFVGAKMSEMRLVRVDLQSMDYEVDDFKSSISEHGFYLTGGYSVSETGKYLLVEIAKPHPTRDKRSISLLYDIVVWGVKEHKVVGGHVDEWGRFVSR